MKRRTIVVVFLGSILIFLLFLSIDLVENPSGSDFFFGVDAVSESVEDVKSLIDEVKSYTNLIVIGSTEITENVSRLDEVCQYAYESGLHFMPYMHISAAFPQPQWVADARQRWGDRFVGLYAFDEAGGHQIDCARPFMLVEEADNYTDAADKFVGLLGEYLRHYTDYYIAAGEFPLFTADYGLYWFDYKAGYDVVLCEFGWNHSRLLNVALNRGAAKMQHKEWGVIITWTYWSPPYIESADELYHDMVLAYVSGAKYVVVFNRPMESPRGVLTEEHLDAMKRFWSYIQVNPRSRGIDAPTSTQTAYVMPKDYAWGFRGVEDKIWGLWVDQLSIEIGTDLNYLLHTHHMGLDIIYDDPQYYSEFHRYSKLIFWNGTIVGGKPEL